MIVVLYYDLNIDYVTQPWEEFETGISYTNVSNGVPCARCCSFMLQDVYDKEGILVPSDVLKAEFIVYQHPKSAEDDQAVFLQ